MRKRADFPDLSTKLKAVIDGRAGMFHVEFGNDPSLAFTAPTTEIILATLKEEKTRTDVKEVFDQHSGSKIRALPGVVSDSFWNETVEDSGKIFAVLGWESSEVSVTHIDTHYIFAEPQYRIAKKPSVRESLRAWLRSLRPSVISRPFMYLSAPCLERSNLCEYTYTV